MIKYDVFYVINTKKYQEREEENKANLELPFDSGLELRAAIKDMQETYRHNEEALCLVARYNGKKSGFKNVQDEEDIENFFYRYYTSDLDM